MRRKVGKGGEEEGREGGRRREGEGIVAEGEERGVKAREVDK